MTQTWLILIYSLPSQPSKKRAYVWRELKRLGSIYLRDGVALLPFKTDLEERLREMAIRIREYDGEADVVAAPAFENGRDAIFRQRLQMERESEYREVYHAGTRFLRDVLEDVDANEFGFPDVDKLESELIRLHRWYQQVKQRDYFGASGDEEVRGILTKCDRSFEEFSSRAADFGMARSDNVEDVFERLGGAAALDTGSEKESPI